MQKRQDQCSPWGDAVLQGKVCTSALASATIVPVAVIVVAVVLKSIACAGVTSIRKIGAITVIFISRYPA